MLTIRSAQSHDGAALFGLMPRLADFPLPPWRTAAEIAAADGPLLRAALDGRLPGSVILTAWEAPGLPLAGFVFVTTKADYFTKAAYAHVEVLVVAPRVEGRGVARALMAAAEQWAETQGHGWITLNVFDKNTRARALYGQLGYEPETIHYRKAL